MKRDVGHETIGLVDVYGILLECRRMQSTLGDALGKLIRVLFPQEGEVECVHLDILHHFHIEHFFTPRSFPSLLF